MAINIDSLKVFLGDVELAPVQRRAIESSSDGEFDTDEEVEAFRESLGGFQFVD